MFRWPQNGILMCTVSSDLSGEEFFLQQWRKHDFPCALIITDLKQLPGMKKTKMVMNSITLKLNLTFETIGNATADKMTA